MGNIAKRIKLLRNFGINTIELFSPQKWGFFIKEAVMDKKSFELYMADLKREREAWCREICKTEKCLREAKEFRREVKKIIDVLKSE